MNNNDKYKKDMMDRNLKKLLVTAFSPVSAAVSFSRRLMLRLKEELVKMTDREAQQHQNSPAFEENLGKLMASSVTQTAADPVFKGRLLHRLMDAGETELRKSPLRIWAPALATAVIIILLLGFLIYPNLMASKDTGITASVTQGAVVVTQVKPLFFIWGDRTAQSSLDTGSTISLAKNDRMTTGPDSMVTIALPNASSLLMYPGSELVISALENKDETSLPVITVKLDSGRVTSEINNLIYELDTPSATATVPGTIFKVEVISADRTYLATTEGVVQLSMDGETVQVSAGEEVDAIKGQPLTVKAERPPKLIIESPERPEVTSETIVLSGRTDIEATITIDNIPLPVDINGSFSTTLTLSPGENPVSIIATSPTGKTTTLNLVLIRQ